MPTPKAPAAPTLRLFGMPMSEVPLTPSARSADRRVAFLSGPADDAGQKGADEIIELEQVGMPDLVLQVDPAMLPSLEAQNARQETRQQTRRGTPQAGLSVDVPLMALGAPTQSWGVGEGGVFADRCQASYWMQRAVPQAPQDCDDVGVVIVDVGVDANYVRSLDGTFAGGWQLVGGGATSLVGRYGDPHSRAADGHGNMIARNVLSQAPSAVIYDAPVLPSRVTDIEGYSSDATLLFEAIAHVIENPHDDPRYPQHDRWIVVNAWGVATGFADVPGPFAYRHSRTHRLNAAIIDLANMPGVDVVFAAGNSGAHDPALHSGAYDRGHGRAIWGANGLSEVFTVAASRSDGMAIGASSPGPAEPRLNGASDPNLKPDFAAPSWFVERHDASTANTGSSAACAVFAGMLARFRARHPDLSAREVKETLGANGSQSWSPATGHSYSRTATV